jgi:hypothetical protein
VPPSQGGANNITPVLLANGGQDNDCSFFYNVKPNSDGTVTTPNGTRLHQFYIDNPKPGTKVTDPATGATFTPTVDTKNNLLSFVSTGASIVDVGVKGGTQTTLYNYDGYVGTPPAPNPTPNYPGSVTQDSNLHPPVSKTSGSGANTTYTFYTVSHVGFCYKPVATVSGTVYTDPDGSHNANNSSPLAGATVTLYDTSGATVTSTTSSATGSSSPNYSFSNVPVGDNYVLCVASTPAGNTYKETSPTANTAQCTGTYTAGNVITNLSSSNGSNQNFFLQPVTPCPSDGSPITYNGPNGIVYTMFSCKGGQVYTFSSGVEPSGIASGNPFVSVLPINTTGTLKPTMERVLLPDPIVSGANGRQPTFKGLAYTDTAPYDPNNLKPLQECMVDPSDASNGHPGTLVNTSASGILPSGEDSCFVSIKTFVDSSGNGWLEAYNYTEIDGHYAGY